VQPQVVSPNRRFLYRLRGHRRLSRSSGQSPDHGCQMEDRQRSVHPVDRCGLLTAPGRPDFLPRGLPRTIDRFFAIRPPQTPARRLSAVGQFAEWHRHSCLCKRIEASDSAGCPMRQCCAWGSFLLRVIRAGHSPAHPHSCRTPHVVADPPWRATVLRAGALSFSLSCALARNLRPERVEGPLLHPPGRLHRLGRAVTCVTALRCHIC